MTTTTVTARNAVDVADAVNAAFEAGTATQVNGRTMKRRHGQKVATSWGNGTVSVSVAGRRAGTMGDVFVKVDQTLVLS